MNDILTVRDLSVHFRQGKRLVQLVDRVSFSVARGECLGILGESGSGKSMTCKALLGLLDDNFQVTGSSRFEGKPLLSQTPEQLRRLRGGKISMVLQNPMSCFDPLYRIGEQMAETLQEHTALKGRPLQKRMEDILRLMRIHDPADVLRKYPHQLSGGMLQRAMIGLAICMQPSLIIADEPTTAIDSISQYAIMQEFLRIKQRGEVSMIFISHDLGVLSLIADRLIVMHDGKAVESGTAQEIFDNATDTYTRHHIKQHRAVMHRFLDALHAPACPGKPRLIHLHTLKGKGVSFMEGQVGWHGKAPNAEQTAQALSELEG